MADHGPVKIRKGQLDDLIKVYKQTYKDLVITIVAATEAGRINKVAVMNRINRELESLNVDVQKWVKAEIPQYYLDGSNQAIQDLNKLGLNPGKLTATVNRDAISALVDDTALSFAEGIRGMSRSAQKILSDAKRQQINFIIAKGKLSGEATKTIAGAVENELRKSGLAAIIDKGGKRWAFDDYTNMLVLTKASEARNQGLVNLMLGNGYDLVQVSDHNSKHKACRVWEGKILSITGNTSGRIKGGYKVAGTLEEAKSEGLFHPRCKHAANVFQPELASITEAYDPETGKYV